MLFKKNILVLSLAVLSGCTGSQAIKMEHPILNMEVLKIPSHGKVVLIDGKAEILKKERSTGYQEVKVGTILDEDDILWMKPGCITKIEFDDGSYILNEKQEKEIFITFEFVTTKDVPKEK